MQYIEIINTHYSEDQTTDETQEIYKNISQCMEINYLYAL